MTQTGEGGSIMKRLRRLTLEDVVDRRNFTSVLQRQYHLLPDHEIERTEVILTVECRSI